MSQGRGRSPEAARRLAANAAGYRALRRTFDPGSPKASGYLSGWSFRRERESVLRALGEAPGVLLDLGCGGGAMTGPLVRAGRPERSSEGPSDGRSATAIPGPPFPRAVVGLDLGAGACEAAGRAGLLAVCGDAFRLPFGDRVADAAVSIEMLQEHRSVEVRRLFTEAARVLRPGGKMLVVWGNRTAWVHRLASALLSRLGRLRRSPGSFPALFHHAPPSMRAAAEGAGFALEEWWALFPPWRLRFRRVEGPWAGLVGSSFLAVFRKPAGSETAPESEVAAAADSATPGRLPNRIPDRDPGRTTGRIPGFIPGRMPAGKREPANAGGAGRSR